MRKKIIIFILATIIVGIAIFLRIIFVCNGDVLENVVYQSKNIIIQQVQKGNKNLIILGSGYSLSVDSQNKIVNHDPLMVFPNVEFQKSTVMSMFYPFESDGLEPAGKDLSVFLNSIMQDYDSITLIGHSKCGICFANAAKWIKHPNVTIVTISAPFHGTFIVDKKVMSEKLNWLEQILFELIFSNHPVDQDVLPNSNFIQSADYSGLSNCTHINIISKCPQSSSNILELILIYLDEKAGIQGDGIVPKSSQHAPSYSNTIEKEIEAIHPASLKIGLETIGF